MRTTSRIALAIAACCSLSGCIKKYQLVVPADFYGPAAAPLTTTGPKVAVYAPPSAAAVPLTIRDTHTGMFTAESDVDPVVFPALENALRAALQPTFDAKLVADPAQARAFDLLVTIDAAVQAMPHQCPKWDPKNPQAPVTYQPCMVRTYAVTLRCSDPQTGFELVHLTRVRWLNDQEKYDPLLVELNSQRRSVILAALEKRLHLLADGFAASLASEPRLQTYAANTAKARVLVSQSSSAQQAGRLQEAFDDCVQALPLAWTGSPEDQSCRAAAMQLAPKLPHPPAISEDARSHMDRGKLLVSHAKTAADYDAAAEELAAAARDAPWWSDAYFNLGLVQASGGHFVPALYDLKLYLAGNPGASDADAVRRKIDEVELKAEGKIAP